MSDNQVGVESVTFATLELTGTMLMALVKKGVLTPAECDRIFDTSVERQFGVGSNVNDGAGRILEEMKTSFRSVVTAS